MSPVADVPVYLSDQAVRRSPLIEVATQAVTGFEPSLRLTVPWQVATSSWFSTVGDQLARVSRFEAGWDSYHARPLDHGRAEVAISFLGRFLERHSEPPAVVPLSDGGLQLEWHSGGVDVEVAFPRDEAPEMYVYVLDTGAEWSGSPDELPPSVAPLVLMSLRRGV
jgi:hypothetical protein